MTNATISPTMCPLCRTVDTTVTEATLAAGGGCALHNVRAAMGCRAPRNGGGLRAVRRVTGHVHLKAGPVDHHRWHPMMAGCGWLELG